MNFTGNVIVIIYRSKERYNFIPVQAQPILIKRIIPNEGQIPGLPANPRLIKDDKFKKLIQSLRDDPEMLNLRELIVFPFKRKFVVIAGNMRLLAMKELEYEEAPCKILSAKTPVEKLRAYTIKDNIGYGEHDWDMLASDWDAEQLTAWGLDIPNWKSAEEEEREAMPNETPQWFLNICCNSESQCQKLYEEFIQKGLDVKIVT